MYSEWSSDAKAVTRMGEHPVTMSCVRLGPQSKTVVHIQALGGSPWAFGVMAPRSRVDVVFLPAPLGWIRNNYASTHMHKLLCLHGWYSVLSSLSPPPPEFIEDFGGSARASKRELGSSSRSTFTNRVTLGKLLISLNLCFLIVYWFLFITLTGDFFF